MSVRTIFGIGLVFLGLALLGIRMWIVNLPEETPQLEQPSQKLYFGKDEQLSLDLPANRSGWTLVAHGPVELEAYGVIDIGGPQSDPRGNATVPRDAKALVPRLPSGAIVAKIGEKGEPFAVEFSNKISMKEMVYVAINDSDYSDNSGSFTLIVKGVPR